jgi:hypothetical protein
VVEFIIRLLCLCIALASVETLHGIARTIYLAPAIGKLKAKQYSIISGSLLAFSVCYLMVPWLGITVVSQLLLLGLFLAVFMALFDIGMGRFVAKQKWAVVLSEFNPVKGNLLAFGLAWLVLCPYLVMRIKGFI